MAPDQDRVDELFRILGDPTRRRILDLLAEREPMTVTELSAHFPSLVRSGISKHLMALREGGLVYSTRHGREQHYCIHQETVNLLLRPWVQKYEKYWDERLEKLRQLAEAMEQVREGSPE